MFQNNHRQFYRELNQEEGRFDDDQPDAIKNRKRFEETYGVSR